MSRIFRRSQSKGNDSSKSLTPPKLENCQNGWKEESDPDKLDPAKVRFDVFCNHWCQIQNTIFKNNSTSGLHRFHSSKVSPDEVQSVINYMRQLVMLLIDEDPPGDGDIGIILKFTNQENLFEKMFVWGEQIGEHAEDMKHELLRSYEMILAQAKQPVLFQDRILNPLLQLLLACWESCSEVLEPQLILLLHQLCVSLTKDQALLEYFFQASPSKGPAKFLLFSLLIPFIHREGSLGQQARDALLLCVSASQEAEHIAKYISESTNLCPVLAGGLGALYSRLPRKLDIQAEHWHCLTDEDVAKTPELIMFLNSLEFCNAVVQVAHPVVSEQLIRYFHDGFLVPVVGPALHQPPNDEITAATAYVELFLKSVTDSRLMKVFLAYICRGWHDNNKIMDSFLTRISSNSKLCLVTMSLMYTLINLNCEDVMMDLVFRYLIPCNHIMASQRRAILDVNYIGSSAHKFLSLIPNFCTSKLVPKFVYSLDSSGSSLEGQVSPRSVHLGERGRVLFQSSQEDLIGDNSLNASRNSILGELEEYNTSLLEYLEDARDGIDKCSRGCQTWSLPYDGVHPPPLMLSPDVDVLRTPSSGGSRLTSLLYTPRHFDGTPFSQKGLRSSESNGRSSSKKGRKRELLADETSSPVQSKSSSPGTLTSTIEEILRLDLGNIKNVDISDVNLADIFQGEKLNILTMEEDFKKKEKTGSNLGFPGSLNITHHKDISVSSDSAFSSTNSPTNDTGGPEKLQNAHRGSSDAIWSNHHEGRRNGSPQNPKHQMEMEQTLRSPISSQSSLREVDEPSVFYMYDSDYETYQGNGQLGTTRECFSDEADEILMALGYDLDKSSPYQERGDSQNFSRLSFTENGFNGDESLTFSQQLQSPGGDTLYSSDSSRTSSPDHKNFRRSLDNGGHDVSGTPVPSKSSQENRKGGQTLSPLTITPRAQYNGSFNSKHMSSAPPYSPVGISRGLPDTGPLLNIIFKKLEGMMQNSLYMNLLLTGIITRMTYYPHPLLRSFLLNTNMVFQPSVKALTQVLMSVKNNLENYAATVSDWDSKLLKAKQYLWARECGQSIQRERSVTLLEGRDKVHARSRSGSQLVTPEKRKTSIGGFFRIGSKRKSALKSSEKHKLAAIGESTSPGSASKAGEYESVKTKNAVYAAVIFEEFLKELAATCQEHAVGLLEDFEQV